MSNLCDRIVPPASVGFNDTIELVWSSYANLRYINGNKGSLRTMQYLRMLIADGKKTLVGRMDVHDSGYKHPGGVIHGRTQKEYVFWTADGISSVTPTSISTPICGRLRGAGTWMRVQEK